MRGSRPSTEAPGQLRLHRAPQGRRTERAGVHRPLHQQAALERALETARDAGVRDAQADVAHAHDPAGELIGRTNGADLIVARSHGAPSWAGIRLGTTASSLLRPATVPVLVARRLPEGSPFPTELLITTDRSRDSATATRLAGAIARIVARATGERVSLVALGSLGPRGLRALGRVSERVPRADPCSVLVTRPRG